MTHTRYDTSHVHTTGQMTNTRCSDDAPESDGNFREKILHYHQLYINRPDHSISFIPVAVDTTGLIYDDFSHLSFLHPNRETSALDNEIPDQFRYLRVDSYPNFKGSVGLILVKTSDMRISVPFNLSSRSFTPLPCFIRSRLPLPLLVPSLVFTPRCSA
jgi:hypothetical protein